MAAMLMLSLLLAALAGELMSGLDVLEAIASAETIEATGGALDLTGFLMLAATGGVSVWAAGALGHYLFRIGVRSKEVAPESCAVRAVHLEGHRPSAHAWLTGRRRRGPPPTV